MGKLSFDQLEQLSKKLKITAEILSEEENVFSLLDFEAAFNLPYNIVGAYTRNSYLKETLELTDEERQVLGKFFGKGNLSYVRITDEKIKNGDFSYEFTSDDEIIKVNYEECKSVYEYLKENGVNATISAFDCAVKRYAFNESILPYQDNYANIKTR